MALRGKSARAQVPLRIPEATRARLEKAAKSRGVSMNAEIVERLERSFESENRFGGPLATALVERIGRAMAAVGECDGYYGADKTGHEREWLHYVIPYDRAAAVAIAILEVNRPKVDGAVPTRNAAEFIERSAAEAVEQSAAEVEHLAQRAAAEGPEGSTPSDMWDRAIRKTEVRYGFAPAAEAGTPGELNEKIQRAYADLGALLAALETLNREEEK